MIGKLLTMQQLADQLSVSQRHIRNLMKDGAIVGINVGTVGRPSWRFGQVDIEAFLQRRRMVRPAQKPLRSSSKGALSPMIEVIDFHQRYRDNLAAKAEVRAKAKVKTEADQARRHSKRRSAKPDAP
ncbi:MAG TPA: helix-turn-helix domain-containing protein [Bosea sp. (in: a-proteobacteria)]|jgi:predicted ArsR family transcriptional regulator|uniref:helix-turn-helix domain-containing protein n=1 Tax=Bosea sp. (in: a-proteobacteria) TaxID=1871050 RepID=UPI002E15CDDB|nr:helix-turn-helix domain-containing protein [Bosea sp. (in: a-proteobacteria)]